MAELEAELARFQAELAMFDQSRAQTSTAASAPPPTQPVSAVQYPRYVAPMPASASAASAYGLQVPTPSLAYPQPGYGQQPFYGAAIPATDPYGASASQQVYAAPQPVIPQQSANASAPRAVPSGAIAAVKAKEEARKRHLEENKKKGPLREAAGDRWRDPSLAEWPENDFRIFVGDLGNEVNDDHLAKAFNKYSSFAKAKVVRDKRTNKTKGFGFVSFLDGNDFAKALKEMNGKYIGNRPCKLRKSTWDERNAFGHGKRKVNNNDVKPTKRHRPDGL